jgi:NADPH2:quinone reductase
MTTPATMNAIQITENGSADVLVLRSVPTPQPEPGKVLVRIHAAGINFVDVYVREGRYPGGLPAIMGQEAAGEVESVGEGVTGFKPGDKVAYCHIMGAYAEYAVVPVSRLLHIPDGLSYQQAAAGLLQGMTAHYLALSTYPLKAGETALFHAGAGGVGLLFTQIAKKIGARVITTVSTEEKAALSREAGADEVILYTQQDFLAETKRLTDNRGVDVVYDSVGKTTFDSSLQCLHQRGMMVLFGGASGPVPPFDLMRLTQSGSLYITRPSLNAYITTRSDLEARAGEVYRWIADGSLKLRIEHLYPLAEARQAHLDLESRKTTGKLLLIP